MLDSKELNDLVSMNATEVALQVLVAAAKVTEIQVWKVDKRCNCYDGHGGKNVDLQSDSERPLHMTVHAARKLCEEKGYAGFTYEPMKGRMWRLATVDEPGEFSMTGGDGIYEVHYKHK